MNRKPPGQQCICSEETLNVCVPAFAVVCGLSVSVCVCGAGRGLVDRALDL